MAIYRVGGTTLIASDIHVHAVRVTMLHCHVVSPVAEATWLHGQGSIEGASLI